ncbi:MAG: hypothetical protein NTV15_07630 [Candidatus Bathyarchaeota archaeon]|nr:hypothetical protein [Candidatus Bathyarchaeota archaeon]
MRIDRVVHLLFTATTIVFLISGYGISEYRLVEVITLGLLSKSLAFRIHSSLGIPFITLLVTHIYLVQMRKRK